MHFLREMGVEVLPVPVKAAQFLPWAENTSHDLADGHDLAHAVGEYVNDPATPVTACQHSDLMAGLLVGQGPALATLTIFGETNEQPEVMSVVIHRPDGQIWTACKSWPWTTRPRRPGTWPWPSWTATGLAESSRTTPCAIPSTARTATPCWSTWPPPPTSGRRRA